MWGYLSFFQSSILYNDTLDLIELFYDKPSTIVKSHIRFFKQSKSQKRPTVTIYFNKIFFDKELCLSILQKRTLLKQFILLNCNDRTWIHFDKFVNTLFLSNCNLMFVDLRRKKSTRLENIPDYNYLPINYTTIEKKPSKIFKKTTTFFNVKAFLIQNSKSKRNTKLHNIPAIKIGFDGSPSPRTYDITIKLSDSKVNHYLAYVYICKLHLSLKEFKILGA